MTRRRAAPVPVTLPLDGCVVTITGKFDCIKHTQASLEKLITLLGGATTKTVTKATTHLVCSEREYNDGTSTRVLAGKAKNLPLVRPEWILESERQQKTLPADGYAWDRPRLPSSQEANGEKRKRQDDADSSGPKRRKTAVGVDAVSTKEPRKTKVKEEPVDKEPFHDIVGKEEQVAVGQFAKTKDASIPVDDCCHLAHQNYTVYIDPDTGMIFDASLNQTHATCNANKFYRIQILSSPDGKTFRTWTRWGRVGEAGQNATLGNGSLDDAKRHFEKKFKDKSGLSWDSRGSNPKPGKYAFVEKSYNPDDDEDKPPKDEAAKEEEECESSECTLEPAIRSLMELIFNQHLFQATMSSLNYDADKLPLGKLSKGNILRGFQQLKDLAALLDDPSLAITRWGMMVPAAVEQLSNMYYSIIPHAFGRNRPPVIRDRVLLRREIDLLESLSDMKDADQILKDLKKVGPNEVNHLDGKFQSLGLSEMTVLDRASDEFRFLQEYLDGSRGETHNVTYKISDIFRIEREGEASRFQEYARNSKIGGNRRLLWHGSRVTNYAGILSQGLRIAPPEAPVSGYMFGKGIYLADMSSKSAGYCCPHISGNQGLLLLCEAKLGDPMQRLTSANSNAGQEALAKGMESTKGEGRTAPTKWMDAGVVHPSLTGISMPDVSVPAGAADVPGAGLWYNEYICYDVAQVKLRYLFRVHM